MKYYIVLAILGMFVLLGVVIRLSNIKRLRGHGPRFSKDAIRKRLDEKRNTDKISHS